MATTITSDGGYTSSTPTDPIPEFKPSSFAENDSFEKDLLRPSIEAEKKYQEEGLKIRQENYKTIKKNTQNFEAFEPTASEEVRNRALVAGYIDTQFGDNDRPSNDHGILRDAIAKHKFGGVGMGSDEAFLGAMRNDYKREDEEQAFWDNLDRKATLSALMEGGAPLEEYKREIKDDPFAKANRLEINDRWRKNREAIEEKYGSSMLFDLRTTLKELKTDEDWLMAASRRTQNYTDEEKTMFISTLRDMASAYPSELPSTFGGNFAKGARRGVMGALDKGSESAMEHLRNAAVGAHNAFITPWPQVFGGESGKEWAREHRAAGEDWLKSERDAVDFQAELRGVQENDFARIQPLAPKDSTRRAIEEGVYAIPGAITTSAIAFVPVVGMPLSFGVMKEFDREKYRNEILSNGGSRDEAYRLAGGMSMVSAVPNMLLEKFQSYGLAGRIPGMDKVFGKIDDIFANKVARFGTKMFVAGVAETTVELTQQANTDLVQDITSAYQSVVPDIEWKNGKDGHFDGYFNKTLTTFVAVAPLGVMVAGRGISLESKAEALKTASPLERKAFGITEEASKMLDEATSPREMVEAFENAVNTREPWSETAQESVMELEAMQDMRAKTNEDAEKFGVSPAVRRTPDSPAFEVFDRATGETIVEVDTAQEAAEEVFTQLQLREEENAHYFQELQASFEAASLDVEQSGESVEVATGKLTDAEVELASPEAGRRLKTERELLEQRDGGTGEVAQEVMSDRNTQTIAGAYTPAGKMGRKEAVTQLYDGSSVLTLIHERGHAKRRKLMQSGAWTRADQLSALQGLDSLIAEAEERFLPYNFAELNEEKQEVAMDEAVAELAEVLALNSRKGKNSKMGNLIKKGLSSMVQARVPGAAQLSSFIKTMGQFFGLQLRRATILKKAVRDGKLDQSQVDQLTDMLVGEDTQELFEQERDAIPTQMVDGQQVDTPFSPTPLSIGNTTVTPNADTKTYPTKDGGVVGPASFSITAHHGTPHKVGKFSTEKIGTGEGAQAYGWGLYFAEALSVAKGYRDTLSESGTDGAKRRLKEAGGDIDAALAAARERASKYKQGGWIAPVALEEDIRFLERYRESGEWTSGSLYTVDLNVEQDELLDWDKPMSEQSESVQEIARRVLPELASTEMQWIPNQGGMTHWTEMADSLEEIPAIEKVISKLDPSQQGRFAPYGEEMMLRMKGEEFYNSIASPTEWSKQVQALNRGMTHGQEASEALAAAGIKGIRYLDGDSRADGEGTSNYVIFNDADIKITEENGQVVDTSSPSFSPGDSRMLAPTTPQEISEAKEPIVEQIYLKETEKFKKGMESGRIKTNADIRNFIGQHMVMHQPDTAMAGEVRVDGESFVKGKGGVYYPVLFSEEGYFWASTAAKAEEMAGALNEIGERNGGKIYMALTSADVDKLFSSTTMSVGTMNFFKQLTKNPRKYGITEAQLNKMLIQASKTQIVSKLLIKGKDGKPVLNEKGEKTYKVKTQEFGHTLSKGSKLNDTMTELEGWLQPFSEDKSTGSSFDVRKSFVFDLMRQVSTHLKGKPAQSKAVAGLLTQESNEFAKNKVIKGDLSLAAFTQGLGDMLSEPLTKTFQKFGNKGKGYIYAVIEIEGKVKAIDTKGHESYPKAIVSAEGKLPTVHVMKDGYHWTDVVQEKDSGARVERVTREMNKVYPTGGFSAYKGRPLQFGDVQENAEGVELSFSPGDARMLSNITPAQDAEYADLAKDPEKNREKLQKMVDQAAKKAGFDVQGFHGKAGAIPEIFNPSNSGENTSWESRPATFFAAKEELAQMFADVAANREGGDPQVLRAYLKTGNSVEKFSTDEAVEDLKARGINSTILKDVQSGELVEYAVFDPNQIKSADPVTYDSDGNVIPLSQRFDQSRDEIAFSPGDARMLSDLSENVMRRVRAPESRAVVFEQLVDRIDALKRDVSKLIFGGTVVQEAIPDDRSMKSLKKESAFRQAARHEELEMELDSEMRTLGADLTVSVQDMPVHSALIDGGYKLITKKRALKEGRMSETDGDFDDAGGLHPLVFGGNTMPDVAAQALAGLQQDGQVLLQEGTVSELYDALAQEWQQVQENRQSNKEAKKKIGEAKKQAKTEADEWLKEAVAKQEKHYNPVTRIRRSLVMYDALLKTLPPELRGKMGGFVQISKLNSDKARLEFLEQKVEQLDVEVDKWISGKHRKQIERIFEANRPKKKPSGVSKVNSDAMYADQVIEIEQISEMTQEQIDEEIEDIDGDIEKAKDEWTLEDLVERRDKLSIFGNIAGMKANALGDFYQNLNTIHKQGKLLKSITDAQFNQFLEETIDIVNEDVTGGQGQMTQSEAKLKEDARTKKKINLKWIGAESVELDGLADFHRKNLPFEWLLNAISRANKAVETMKSKTNQRLGTMVHLATTASDRGEMRILEEYREAMGEIFGIRVGGPLNVLPALENKITEMEKVHQTKVFKMEYEEGGKSVTRTIPMSKVKAIIEDKATLDGLGLSPADWSAIKESHAEMVKQKQAKEDEKAKAAKRTPKKVSLAASAKITYEAPMEGESKPMVLSQSQAINLAMLWRQEGLQDSMRHEGYSDKTMEEMENFLTEESKQIRDWLTIKYEENYHKINKVFRAQNGFSLPKIDFYSPAMRMAQKEAKDMSIDSQGRQAMSVSPEFTITRTKNRAPMDQKAGALSIYMSHALQTNHYVSWADTVKVLRSVFANKDVRANIAGYVGASALSTIEERIQWFADGGNRKATHIKLMDSLRAAHTYSALAFKWSILVKQLTSLPAYAFDMGFKDFSKYGMKFLKNPIRNLRSMRQTEYVKTRFKKGYERDVIDGLRSRDKASVFRKMLQVGMLSGKVGDIIPVMIGGWIAREQAYDAARAEGLSEADAKRKAEITFEMVSDRSQQAGGLKDLSSFQGEGSIFKLFTMYKTSPRQYYANVYESLLDAGGVKGLIKGDGKKNSRAQFTRRFLISHVILPMTFQFVSDATRMGLRPDDEDAFQWESYLRAMLLGPLNGVFILGDMVDLLSSAVAGTHMWEKVLPVLNGPTEVAKGIYELGDGDFEDAADEIVRGIGKMTPSALTFYDLLTDEARRLRITE